MAKTSSTSGQAPTDVDEKTQIQALDRTQPTLPIKPGRSARMTHDYKRNGTTSLYAALEIATGEVTGACYPQHRHPRVPEYPREGLPAPAAARRARQLLDTLHARGRALAQATQTRAFPLHPDQRIVDEHGRDLFSILTNQQVRRGVYHDVPELITAIEHFITGYNKRAQPFVWTKTPDQIHAKARKEQTTSGTLH